MGVFIMKNMLLKNGTEVIIRKAEKKMLKI